MGGREEEAQEERREGGMVGCRTYHLAGTSQAGVGTSSGCIHLWRFFRESRTSCSATASYDEEKEGRDGGREGERVAF